MATPDASDGAEHYFTPEPSAASRPGVVSMTLPDLQVELQTDRGVFSRGGVDAGTKLLLVEAPQPPPDPSVLLDLGCGYGPIAVTLARRAPRATVWAVDVNRRALGLTAANAETAGVADRVHPALPADVPPDLRFDRIYSNPPGRIGKRELHQMLSFWLGRLTPDGRGWLVVHKHLGSDSLVRWLAADGFSVHRLQSRMGYRILEVAVS